MTIKTAARQDGRPAVFIDLSIFTMVSLGLFIIITPLMRGLFFEEEFVLAQMFLALIWLFFSLDRLLKKETIIKLTIQDLFALGFVLAYISSLFFAVHLKEAVYGVFRALACVSLYFIVSYYAKKERARTGLITVIFVSSVLVAAVGLLAAAQTLAYPGAYGGNRIMSVFQYPNAFGIFAALGFFLGGGLFFYSSHCLLKAVAALGIYLNLVGLIGSQSRGAWLIFGFGLLAFLLGTRKEEIWGVIYNLFFLLLSGLLGSKGFLQGVSDGHYLSAYKWLALGAFLAIAAVILIHYLPVLIDRSSILSMYRPILAWVLAVNLLFGVIYYFTYTSSVLPSAAGQLITTDVLARTGQISGAESSFQARVEMSRLALRIIGDHPLLGVGAGGWNALYHLYQDRVYWSSEVHNHFLQTWLEAGLAGFLFYLAFWFVLIRRLVKTFLRRKTGKRWPFVWSTTVGFLVLLVHSGMDFDLSLPAIALVLWSVGAVLFQEAAPDRGVADLVRTVRPAVPLYLFMMLSVLLLLFYPACREYRAGILSAEGARALLEKQYPLALEKMEQAYRLSPLSANIAADLAQLYASRYQAFRESADKEQSYHFASKAVTLAPFNIRSSEAVSRAYLLLDDKEAALAESERMAAVLPQDVAAQENLARNYLVSGMNYLEREEMTLARIYLERVIRISAQVEENYRKSNENTEMKPTPQLMLAAGQASFLLGDRTGAAVKLEEAFTYRETKDVAGLWLAAVYQDYDPAQHDSLYNRYIGSDAQKITSYQTILKWLSYVY